MERGTRIEQNKVRGEEIKARAEYVRCPVCAQEFVDANGMERNLEAAYAVYRERHGVPSPADIRALRAKYGASQKAFGLILGFGELTINSYEQGALPDEPNSNLLRLVESPENFRSLYKGALDKIGPIQKRRIESSLAALPRTKKQEYVWDARNAYCGDTTEVSIYTGFTQPDKTKLLRLVQAILVRRETRIYKTSILKLLVYSDCLYCREHSVSMTGWRYAAIDHGPVPDEFN